jgi:hypothetical protein
VAVHFRLVIADYLICGLDAMPAQFSFWRVELRRWHGTFWAGVDPAWFIRQKSETLPAFGTNLRREQQIGSAPHVNDLLNQIFLLFIVQQRGILDVAKASDPLC